MCLYHTCTLPYKQEEAQADEEGEKKKMTKKKKSKMKNLFKNSDLFKKNKRIFCLAQKQRYLRKKADPKIKTS